MTASEVRVFAKNSRKGDYIVKTRMCEFHEKASEFLARRRRLFVSS